MLYITKGMPSPQFTRKRNEIRRSDEWHKIQKGDTKAIRAQFDLLPKEALRDTLLREQHFLCAYCMKRVMNNSHTTVEHWIPLSRDKEKALDYANMLAVCDGGRNTTGSQKVLCCDAAKGDDAEITVNPLNMRQMEQIRYLSNGKIYTEPVDADIEKDINDRLRLNGILDSQGRLVTDTSTELVRGRREAYRWCKMLFQRLDKAGKCTAAMIGKQIDLIRNAEEMPEFAGVKLYFLQKKYRELQKRSL